MNKTPVRPSSADAGMSLTEQQNRRRAQQGRAVQPQMPSQMRPIGSTANRAPVQQAQPRLSHDPRTARTVPGQPAFRHNLESRPPMYNGQPMNNRMQQRPGMIPQGQKMQPVPAQYARPSRPAQMQRSSVNNPVTMRAPQPRQRTTGAPVPNNAPQSFQPALNSAQAQQSLFGRLNDDVRAPKPLRHPPADPNAPIQTMEARPTQPVKQAPLNGLAGAR